MVSLYNCKHDGDQYRVTKFTDSLEIESSYLVDSSECECPAFAKRGKCKHQEMLPFFVNRGAVGKGEMFDWDRGGWVRMFEDPEPEPAIAPLPTGVVMIGLDDPELLFNTIADAVGEPRAPARPATKLRRR